jgi:hypothetical protein
MEHLILDRGDALVSVPTHPRVEGGELLSKTSILRFGTLRIGQLLAPDIVGLGVSSLWTASIGVGFPVIARTMVI